MTRHWTGWKEVAADVGAIQDALGRYFNGRGEALYGQTKQGAWLKLSRVSRESGFPAYGEDQDGASFVLHAVKVGEAK